MRRFVNQGRDDKYVIFYSFLGSKKISIKSLFQQLMMYKQPCDSCPLNSKSIFHQLPLHSQRNYFPAHAATVFLYDLKSQTTVMTFNQIGDT